MQVKAAYTGVVTKGVRTVLYGGIFLIGVSLPAGASATTIYLTSGTTWAIPSDWNSSNNTIEVIGGGAGGATGDGQWGGGGGGGGGGYSKISNLTLTAGGTAYVSIGSGGGASTNGGDTWFNNVNAAATSTTGGALAKGGTAGTAGASGAGGAGGASGSGVGSTKYSGGSGATQSGGIGGGGGGAAGLNGAGTTPSCGGGGGCPGGSGDAGSGGAGGTQTSNSNGGAGGNGTEWDSTHGSGGGGGGGASSDTQNAYNGGTGGLYGAGGGGGGGAFGGCSPGAGGAGRQGLIVITYSPSLPSAARDLTVTKAVSVTGNVTVSSNLTKGSGTFVIDHPLDPENKLLYHSFVESPDALNEYTGTTKIGKNGEATVRLPNYFEALNGNYQYFVRPVDAPMPGLYIKQEVKNNTFVIAGGVSGKGVSWMVTGIRHDPYILANPIIPEVEKGPDQLVDKGEYIFEGNVPDYPTLFGRLWDVFKRWFSAP